MTGPDAVILYVIRLKNMSRIRFGTKALLAMVAICALVLGYYAKTKSDARVRSLAAKRLHVLGCQTLLDTEFDGMTSASFSVNGLTKTFVYP